VTVETEGLKTVLDLSKPELVGKVIAILHDEIFRDRSNVQLVASTIRMRQWIEELMVANDCLEQMVVRRDADREASYWAGYESRSIGVDRGYKPAYLP